MTSFHPVTAVFPNGLFLDGARADARIDGRVMGARLVRAYDAATSFELELWDDDFEILAGGLLARRGAPRGKLDRGAWARFGQAQIPVDDIMFRLAGVEGGFGENGHTMTVTVEDEVAALMRRHTAALKLRRDRDSTRADFIGLMAREVKETRIRYRSPEQGIAQNIKGNDVELRADKERKRGLSSRDITVKGLRATKQQRAFIEAALGVADDVGAGERATIAMLCAGIGESDFTNVVNSLGYGGVFQGQVAVPNGTNWFARMQPLQRTREEARSFFLGGRGYQAGGAIKLAAGDANLGPGDIATKVEASGKPGRFYGQWQGEAQTIFDAYGGVGAIKVTRHRYNFKREKKETSWAASGRLADEVRWRRWADRNTLWYVSDEWLYKRHPRFVIQRGKLARLIIVHDGIAHTVLSVSNYSADVGKPVGEITFTCMLNDRWAGAPGAVVELDDLGPLSDKWLIANHELDLFTGVSTITIRRPAPKLPEPAPQFESRVISTGDSIPLKRIKAGSEWGGTLAIFMSFVTPFMAEHGLQEGSAKRDPGTNDAVGGSGTSDHLTTNKNAYAIDYPTFTGAQIADDLAAAMGFNGWKINSYTSFNITVDASGQLRLHRSGVTVETGAKPRIFRVQILFGGAIGHADHIHVGIKRVG